MDHLHRNRLPTPLPQECAAVTWLQQWTDALFLHFPVGAEELKPHVPPEVEIDTFAGRAWLSYVFFRLKLRPAWLPFVPGLSSLVELNVRTYVRRRGQPGICFLRMYADNRLAIWASQWLTPLCYEPAVMLDERLADGTRRIECRPLHRATGVLSVTFSVASAPQPVQEESLDAWLLERYRLFVSEFPVVGPDGRVHTEPFHVVMGFAATQYGVAILGRASQKQVVNVAQRGGMCVVLIGRHNARLHGPS